MTIRPLPSPHRSFDRIALLQQNVERVIRGKSEVVQLCIAALLAKGHILLEDVPGVGKTTLAHALARSLSLSFQRIQFTSDLLPADIVGVTIYKQDQEFEFVSGPIFTSVLLADEINRATPKTQSALLEAMSEGMITIEKNRLPLPEASIRGILTAVRADPFDRIYGGWAPTIRSGARATLEASAGRYIQFLRGEAPG